MKTTKKDKPITTQKELQKRLDALGVSDEDTLKSVACSLVGHSNIQSGCFGYFYCGRCGDQLGDSLASVYDASKVVIVGHKCPTCVTNFAACTWKDTFMVPNPFAEELV